MRTQKTLCLLFALFLSYSNLQAQEYELNKRESRLSWTGKAAFESYAPTGSLDVDKGELILDGQKITKLSVTADMKSLHHENKDLKSHLKGKDFFEVKTYPSATFILTEPVNFSDEPVLLTGEFTIKGITKKETINIRLIQKNNTVELLFETVLDRTAYGVEYNSPSIFEKIKENAIADEFELQATLIFQ